MVVSSQTMTQRDSFTFFIYFSPLSFFFTKLRQQTWFNNHEKCHCGRGDNKEPKFTVFKSKEIWNLKFYRKKELNSMNFEGIKMSSIFDKIWTMWHILEVYHYEIFVSVGSIPKFEFY